MWLVGWVQACLNLMCDEEGGVTVKIGAFTERKAIFVELDLYGILSNGLGGEKRNEICLGRGV